MSNESDPFAGIQSEVKGHKNRWSEQPRTAEPRQQAASSSKLPPAKLQTNIDADLYDRLMRYAADNRWTKRIVTEDAIRLLLEKNGY